MSMLELLTRQALANLSRQMTEPQAQDFLRREFALSDKEAYLLAGRAPSQYQHALQNIALELKARMKKLRPAELDSFVLELFPSLGEKERTMIISTLDEEFPPKGEDEFHPIFILIEQGLESTAQQFKVNQTQKFFAEKFPELSSEVELLVQPFVIDRYRAVEKVVETLEEETRDRSEEEILKMIAEKLPSLGSAERNMFISALDEEIPPKEE